MRKVDLSGLRFGRLIVQKRIATSMVARYECICDCGGKKETNGTNLTRGLTKSCGCLAREVGRANGLATKKHGMEKHPLYAAWCGMMARCYNAGNSSFAKHGGRGIKVDAPWHDVRVFIQDMNPRPAGHVLDRRDNDGPFSKLNCRWVIIRDKARNRPFHNVRLAHAGRSLLLVEWAELLGVPYYLIANRWKRGMSIPEILSTEHYTPNLKHGLHDSRMHRAWRTMLDRCFNPNSKNPIDVDVCPQWRAFDRFLADMGAPAPGQVLRRRINARGFSPDNCYWGARASRKGIPRAERCG